MYAGAPALLCGVIFGLNIAARANVWRVGNPFRHPATCLKAVIWTFFMVYPQMCNIILSMLYCKRFHDGSEFLVADMNVRCDSDEPVSGYIFAGLTFPQVQLFAWAATLVYLPGVPLFFVAVLLWKRDSLFMSSQSALLEVKAKTDRIVTILQARNLQFDMVDLHEDPEIRKDMEELSGDGQTLPQLFIDGDYLLDGLEELQYLHDNNLL